MTEREYIDFISGDIQDLINALDDDPNTSAKVKGKAKGIQNRINKFYENYEDYGNWIKCTEETPEVGVKVLVACYGSDIVIPNDGETVWQTRQRLTKDIKRVTLGFIDDDGYWDGADYMPMMISPTYWQPLPEAPEYEADPDDVDNGLTWSEFFSKAWDKSEGEE